MKLYRVVFKTFKHTMPTNPMVITEALLECDEVVVVDGALVFLISDRTIKAIPPGAWIDCDEVEKDETVEKPVLVTP